MISSKWNYGLALTSLFFVGLSMYWHWWWMAIIWCMAGVAHTFIGMVKDARTRD